MNQEQRVYNNVMMGIEAAAMRSFQNDISSNPKLSTELATTSSIINKLPKIDSNCSDSDRTITNRFGECSNFEEDQVRVNGMARALETISQKFEKKSKWLEAKTGEGKTYYWNKKTLGNLRNEINVYIYIYIT